MPYTLEQKQWALKQAGLDTNLYDVDDDGNVLDKVIKQPTSTAPPITLDSLTAKPVEQSIPSVLGRSALRSAFPTVAGGAGGAAGIAAASWLLGPEVGAPVTIGAMLLGSLGASAGAQKLQNSLASKGGVFDPAVAAQEYEQHPYASIGGNIAAMPLGGFNPSLANVGRAARTAKSLALTGEAIPMASTVGGEVNPLMGVADKANLMNVALGATLAPATSVGREIVESYRDNRPIHLDPKALLGEAALGAVFNKPNALGRAVGFHDIQAPTDVLPTKNDLDLRTTPSNVRQEGEVPTFVKDEGSTKTRGTRLYLDEHGQPLNEKENDVLGGIKGEFHPHDNPVIYYLDSNGVLKQGTQTYIPKGQKLGTEQLHADESEIIKSEPVVTDLEKAIKSKLDEAGLSGAVTPKFMQKMVKMAELRGVKLNENNQLVGASGFPINGRALLRDSITPEPATSEVNTKRAGIDTPPHELFHQFFNDLKLSKNPKDQVLYKRALELVSKSPEYAKDLAGFQAQGKAGRDAEEFLTQEQGVNIARRMLQLDEPIKPSDQWKKDFELARKAKKNPDDMTIGELRDYLSRRFLTDAPYETYYAKELGAGTTKGTTLPKDETKSKEEAATEPVGEVKKDAQSLPPLKFGADDLKAKVEKPISKVFEQGESNLKELGETFGAGRGELKYKGRESYSDKELSFIKSILAKGLHGIYRPQDIHEASSRNLANTTRTEMQNFEERYGNNNVRMGRREVKIPVDYPLAKQYIEKIKNASKPEDYLNAAKEMGLEVYGGGYLKDGEITYDRFQNESNLHEKQDYTPEDLARYNELVEKSQQGKLSDRFASMGALEELRNKYKGMGPKVAEQPESNLNDETPKPLERDIIEKYSKRGYGAAAKGNTYRSGEGTSATARKLQENRKAALGDKYEKFDTIRYTMRQNKEAKGMVLNLSEPNPKFKSDVETPDESPNLRTKEGRELDKIVNRLWARYFARPEALAHLDKEDVKSHVLQDIYKNGIDVTPRQSNDILPQIGRTMWRSAESYMKNEIQKYERNQKKMGTKSLDEKIGDEGGNTLGDIIGAPSGDEQIYRRKEGGGYEAINSDDTTGYDLAHKLEQHGASEELIAKAEDFGSQDISEQEFLADNGLEPDYFSAREQPVSNLIDDNGQLTTKTEKMLRDPAVSKLPFNQFGRANGDQLLNAIKNKVTPAEWDMLDKAGIREKFQFKDVNKDDALRWVKENGPKIEIKKFGTDIKISKAKKEYDEMWHAYESNGIYPVENKDGSISFMNMRDGQEVKDYKPSEGALKAAKRFNELSEIVENEEMKLGGPTEAAHWQSIAPKAERDMPGYVEGAVVLPKASFEDIAKRDNIEPNEENRKAYELNKNSKAFDLFPSSHNFPPNTLGFFRGYMETLPNGEKVFHVIEAQSDWAQRQRKEEYRQPSPEMAADNPFRNVELAPGKTIKESGHPLLRDYNRLILKAAIEHARKEGATHIAISDAETAMITEGHDLQGALRDWADKGMEFDTKEEAEHEKTYWQDNEDGTKYRVEQKGDKWYLRPELNQEGGMRLNYDTILPKIAEELTGSKGEKVSLGEHKNAFESNQTYQGARRRPEDIQYNQRYNLIFRNADGTPKTDVSGMKYPLESINKKLESGDNFTLFNKHQSFSALTDAIKPDIERIAKMDHPEAKEVAKGFTKFYENKRYYTGQLNNDVLPKLKKFINYTNPKELWTLDNDKFQHVVERRWDMQDYGKSSIQLTPEEKIIDKAIEDNLHKSLDFKNKILPQSQFQTPTPDYLPMTPSRRTIDILTNRAGSTEHQQLIKDWHDYYVNTLGKSIRESEAALDNFTKAYDKKFANLAQQFGPIDKSSGLGIPRSWRERQLVDIMSRFNNRYARRLAYMDSIESNKKVMAALKNPTGIGHSEIVRRVHENINGATEAEEAKRTAFSGLVRSGMLGPLTGAKDFVSNFTLGWQHMEPSQTIASTASALKDIKENWKASFEQGVNRENISSIEFGEGGIDEVVSGMRRVRDILSTVQGRNHLERVTRAIAMGQGRYLVKDNLAKFQNGSLSSQGKKFLENFMPDYATKKNPTQQDMDAAAARYVESVQGTYDYRGLPHMAIQGSWAPVLSLARWNIEKMNNFNKHVIEPMTKGDFKPFLMQTLGMVLGGAATEKLVEEVTNRKSKLPEAKEIKQLFEEGRDKDGMTAAAYKLAGMSSMSGYGGMLTDLMRIPLDVKFGNRPQGYDNPTIWAMQSVYQHYSDLQEAIQNGDIPKVTDVVNRVLSDYLQSYRLGINQFSQEQREKLKDSDQMRDLKIWKVTHDQDVAGYNKDLPNPYLDSDVKEFKKTSDIGAAMEMLPELLAEAIKDAGNNPEQLRKNLAKLKQNSFQTFPNPETVPYTFLNYVTWLQKKNPVEAQESLQSYLTRNTINKVKSSLVP